jgi:hypothetical protein
MGAKIFEILKKYQKNVDKENKMGYNKEINGG